MTMMFNPYTGTPRHPSDIASDPEGLLIEEPGAPLPPASAQQAAEPCADCVSLRQHLTLANGLIESMQTLQAVQGRSDERAARLGLAQVKQADERGDEAMRRAHAAEAVLAELVPAVDLYLDALSAHDDAFVFADDDLENETNAAAEQAYARLVPLLEAARAALAGQPAVREGAPK